MHRRQSQCLFELLDEIISDNICLLCIIEEMDGLPFVTYRNASHICCDGHGINGLMSAERFLETVY